MQTNLIEVGSPLGGEERANLLAEVDVEAAFNEIVAELENVPSATFEVLDGEGRDKMYGGNDPNFLTHRSGR